MASFDHMTTIDSWFFRNNNPSGSSTTTNDNCIFMDLPWFAESFTRETETLTKALQQSIFTNDNSNTSSFSTDNTFTPQQDPLSPFLDSLTKPETAPTSAVSNASLSSSDPETPSKHQKSGSGVGAAAAVGVGVGVGVKPKISKRKSRATKRSHTTFITANPENFRQMVQQVTGVRFGNAQGNVPLVLKPEPQRPGNRLTGRCVSSNILPTLDTSAFLLDQHVEQQPHVDVGSAHAAAAAVSGPLSYASPPVVVAEGGCAGGALDFDSLACFPTLESWNAI